MIGAAYSWFTSCNKHSRKTLATPISVWHSTSKNKSKFSSWTENTRISFKLGGVHTRKLALGLVSHRDHDDYLILYRIYTIRASSWIEENYACANPFQSIERPISYRNEWLFFVYMMLLRDFVPEWNSRLGTATGVNSRRYDSFWYDIFLVVSRKWTQNHKREPEWTRSRTKVALVLCQHPLSGLTMEGPLATCCIVAFLKSVS